MDQHKLISSTRRAILQALGIAAAAIAPAAHADELTTDATLEPDLPIIDPHHHLFDTPGAKPGPFPTRYLFEQYLADAQSGHNIQKTVIVGGEGFSRADGPEHLRVVGDTEFCNGAAAQSASGKYGALRDGAGIVGQADLTMGAGVREVLEAHVHAGGGRFRGIRHMTVWSDEPKLAPPGKMAAPDEAFHADFRAGFAQLAPLGLSFDAWCYFTQIDGIIGLARDFPQTTIIMNHCGGPLGIGKYANDAGARQSWAKLVKQLGQYPNVYMKLGGLGMWTTGLPCTRTKSSAAQIAAEEKPYLETCIAAFGPERCMFESNYPVEAGVGSYHTVWNAFKHVTAGYSDAEKAHLYFESARKAYRLA